MTALKSSLHLSVDGGLIKHWAKALGPSQRGPVRALTPLSDIGESVSLIWVDLSLPHLPDWSDPAWQRVLQKTQMRVVAASSSPSDDEGMAALDAGCAAYCHAYSDALTLKRVQDVVEAGNVWIGRDLMTRLLKSTARAGKSIAAEAPDWAEGLTGREREVANLAANGASNQAIADQCGITERTVKAHLSAVFEKLNVTDRLQLALRVHGIH
jgi:DNA-binding NarL/FixJ family response regulator